jgi:gamma-glutamyltranspeptidase/glutathione hydrolase
MSETVESDSGMVVAPHRAAAEAGAAVLREGGNALEAAVATAATIAVVYPHMNSIGGDCFALVAEPGRPARALMASGGAGSLATIDRYEGKGYDAVPGRGPDAALTVAGAVSGWQLLYEIAAALGGRLSRRDLLGDAVGRAKAGSAVTRHQARVTAEYIDELAPVFGFAQAFLIDGRAPEIGAVIRQERLADTLDRLAHAGFGDFYRGDIAAEIAADLETAGSPVTRDDLRRHEARLAEPLSVALADATVFNTPPPTQGLASLILLALYDRLGVKRGESFEHMHGLIEATKRAFIVRDAEITDPAFGNDVGRYLEPAWLDAEADRIDRKLGAPFGGLSEKGDTIWLGAIDRNGIAVSLIQSIFWEFGSGVVLPRTGITWQNRGVSFSLDRKSRNPLMPGRKPFHTLNAPLARFKDGRVLSYGSMGGDGQPQFQAQIFTRHVRFGMDPGSAIDAPRFLLGTTWGRRGPGLKLESRFDPDVAAALERAGHPVVTMAEAYLDVMGHAGMILRRPDGRILGASDPRSDGAAVAG